MFHNNFRGLATMNTFKRNKLHTNRTKMIRLGFLGLILMITSNILFSATKDCYTCNPEYVPGNPVEGNKTLSQLSQISLSLLSDGDGAFMGNLYGFCMAFPGDIRGAKTLKKRIISRMEKTAPNGKIDLYFLEAGCDPQHLEGGSRVPITQVAAELPSDRLDHLDVLKKYFVENKKEDLFEKAINAKNTKGQTTLDYLSYLIDNKKFDQTQMEASESFRKYLCSNGGIYSYYKNKTCDTAVTKK